MTIDYTKPPQFPPPQPPMMPPPGGPVPPQGGSTKKTCGAIAGIGCLVVIVAIVAITAGIVFFVFNLIKSTYVYKTAVQRAESNPRVIALLGSPVGTGWWVRGSVNLDNDRGHADVTIPIEGPKGEAKIHCVATRSHDAWTFEELMVIPDKGGTSIDLLK